MQFLERSKSGLMFILHVDSIVKQLLYRYVELKIDIYVNQVLSHVGMINM